MLNVLSFIAGARLTWFFFEFSNYDKQSCISHRIEILEEEWNAQHLFDQQQDAREKGDIYSRLNVIEKLLQIKKERKNGSI